MMDCEHEETHTWEEILRYIKCELSHTLVAKVEIEQFISERTHKACFIVQCLMCRSNSVKFLIILLVFKCLFYL
jgi:GTPase Era involved in 16S rRNA processing